MMLTEQTVVLSAALPLQTMKDHLRVGTGFADDGMQDTLIEAHLRAAIAAIEGRIGKALFERRFLWQVTDWRERQGAQALPISPVSQLVSLRIIDASGTVEVVETARYRLVLDLQRPKLVGIGTALPTIPEGGTAELVFDAGFGAAWTDIPADLAQAVLLLAAEFYERRHDGGQGGLALPKAVQGLIERWRTVRVLGGGGV
jgi:uncharacterized phiE125 gp8 family phage protein